MKKLTLTLAGLAVAASVVLGGTASASATVHPCGTKCRLAPASADGRATLPTPKKIVVPPTFGGRA